MGTAGFQNFFPTLTATLGYSRIGSLLLVAPPYVFITFYTYFHGWLSDRLQRRFWFLVYPVPLTIIGLVVFMCTDSFAAKYVSLFLMMFALCMAGTIYSWIASSLARPTAKRATAYAVINALGNATGIWTPFTYRSQDEPHYRLALGICCGLQLTAAILGVLFRFMLTRENEKLRKIEADGAATEGQSLRRLEETAAEMGTDIEAARKIVGSFRCLI